MNAFKTSVPLSKGVNFRLLWHILPYLYISVTSLHYLFIDNIIDISLKDWRRETHTQKRQILKPTRCETGPKQCNNVDLWNSKMFNHPTHSISKSWPELHICIESYLYINKTLQPDLWEHVQTIRLSAQCMFDTIILQFYLSFSTQKCFFLMFTITEIFAVFTWTIILFFLIWFSCKWECILKW